MKRRPSALAPRTMADLAHRVRSSRWPRRLILIGAGPRLHLACGHVGFEAWRITPGGDFARCGYCGKGVAA